MNQPEEQLYASLEALAQAEGLQDTSRALPYMRRCHAGQLRKPIRTGQSLPYIVHPMTMACHAHAMGIREDGVLAAALLHDVCEDCGVRPEQLPVSAPVQRAVALLTKDKGRCRGAGRAQALADYYRGIRQDPIAMLTKCLDRCHNLSTAASSYSLEKLAEYLEETEREVLPLLELLRQRCPGWQGAVFLLGYQIGGLMETAKALLGQKS